MSLVSHNAKGLGSSRVKSPRVVFLGKTLNFHSASPTGVLLGQPYKMLWSNLQ